MVRLKLPLLGRQPCWVACLSMSYLAESTLWKSALLVSLLSVLDFTKTSFSNLTAIYNIHGNHHNLEKSQTDNKKPSERVYFWLHLSYSESAPRFFNKFFRTL
jgi:hypothetical protein